MYVVWMLLGVVIFIVLFIIYNVIMFFVKTKKYYQGKHHCNYCKKSYYLSKDERNNYKFCPYCGNELDYHYKDERTMFKIADDNYSS